MLPNNDTYEFTKNPPRFGLHDDVQTLITTAHRKGYTHYLYGGLVIQIVKSGRWFISFRQDETGAQIFHEASGEGMVFNADRDNEAFKHFLEKIEETK